MTLSTTSCAVLLLGGTPRVGSSTFPQGKQTAEVHTVQATPLVGDYFSLSIDL
jgi:hypothetical protein